MRCLRGGVELHRGVEFLACVQHPVASGQRGEHVRKRDADVGLGALGLFDQRIFFALDQRIEIARCLRGRSIEHRNRERVVGHDGQRGLKILARAGKVTRVEFPQSGAERGREGWVEVVIARRGTGFGSRRRTLCY